MTDIDLGALLAAAAEPRPPISTPDDIPTGKSPADQAIAGYTMAVNMVCAAAEADCHADYRRRQEIYAAEITRLHIEGGTADPAVIEQLRTETAAGEVRARRCAELNGTAKLGYEHVGDLMRHLLDALHSLPAPHDERQADALRAKECELVAVAVDTINAMTQRWLDFHGGNTTVDQFLAAHNLDTTVPSY